MSLNIEFGNTQFTDIGYATETEMLSSEGLVIVVKPCDWPCQYTGAPGYIELRATRFITAEKDKTDSMFLEVTLSSPNVNNAYNSEDTWSRATAVLDEQDPDADNGIQRAVEQWQLKRGLVTDFSTDFNSEVITLRFYEALHTIIGSGDDPKEYRYHPEDEVGGN